MVLQMKANRHFERVSALEQKGICPRDADDLRHNNCQTGCTIAQPGNASTPTEPTGRCIVDFRLSVRNEKL